MLDKRLIAKTFPKVNEKNVVLWKDYRVSVLSDRLFRLEKSENGKFRDEATLSVWFRNMPPQCFSVKENADSLEVKTASVLLILKEKREDCCVVLGGEEKPIDNSGNLKGTARTLDCFDGEFTRDGKKLVLEDGVCSKTGVAVLDDSNSATLCANGEIAKEYADGTDEYVFAYGKDYRGAIKALYSICGGVPLVPRYALGNWWSRYRKYTDEEYLKVLHRFEEREIPLSVATIDMDWHYSDYLDEQKKITESGKNTPFYGGNNGWTGYSWNKELFPDYKKFLKQVKSQNLKITLNLHPADGVRWFEDCYEDMAKAVGVDATTQERIAFDIFDPVFTNAYFSVLHHPYEKAGVDFWWIDWQQGTCAGKLGIDPLWALNHYHYLDNARKDGPLVLSRYGGVGTHRYPLGFSGDTKISWELLDYLPWFTATASNVGYGWWSHDIGGHHFGTHDGELYLRHVQYGVFSPINRYHCTATPTLTKEPWAYLNGTGALAEEQMRFRHKLVPFLYTCSHRSYTDAEMLIEPLYYEHPEKEVAYRYPNEYYFGKSLLVAPVTSPEEKDGYARVKVWLPKGTWTDIFTGDEYRIENEEGEEKVLLRTLESIPVLAKAGTVLPLSQEKGNGTPNPKMLTVKVFNGNGTFEMYEDGAEERKKGEFYTSFEAKERVGKDGKNTQILKISSRGEASVIPQERKLLVRFENIEEGELVFKADGKRVKTEHIYSDQVSVSFDFEAGKVYEISVTYKPLTKFEAWKKRAVKILSEANGENTANMQCDEYLQKTKSFEELLFSLSIWMPVPEATKKRLRETM